MNAVTTKTSVSADSFTPLSNGPWQSADSERSFRRQLLAHITGVATLSVIIANIQLPQVTVVKAIKESAASYAEIILPGPLPEPEIVMPKLPEVKQTIPEIKKPAVKQALVAAVEQTVKAAREKAKLAGILAFQDDLAEMRDAIDPASLQDTASLSSGRGEAARLERDLISSDKPSRQANVDLTQVSRRTGGIALAGRESTRVEAPEESTSENTGAVRVTRVEAAHLRSIEDVRRVFDANKGAIFAIYNRALRRNPGLLGKMVLELVIQPDGSVSHCLVTLSELEDTDLIEKVVQRIQLFNFGAKDVAETTINYPVHFLPG